MKSEKVKKKDNKGITLIALIITVIVMLILAGVAINLSIGDNGIFKKTQEASEISKKASIKEDLELRITDMEMEKIREGKILTKEDVAKGLEKIGAVILTYDENTIDGEYGDYQIIVDRDNKVTVGGALTGAKPKMEFLVSTEEIGVLELELTVVGTTEDGGIASIESMDGLTLLSGDGTSGNKYKVTENKEYRFKVTGTNGRIAIGTKKISNLVQESETLLKAISEIKTAGKTKVKVKGRTQENNEETEIYPLNVVYFDGDLTLKDQAVSGGQAKTIEGLTLDGTTWRVGNVEDVNTNSVVLKVNGDLTLESEYKLSSVKSGTAVGKGLFIYCTGKLTIDGTVDMRGVTCSATAQNVYVCKNPDESFKYVRKNGGTAVTGDATVGNGYNPADGKIICGSGGAGSQGSSDAGAASRHAGPVNLSTSGNSWCGGIGRNL